jgi:hypothetical protein
MVNKMSNQLNYYGKKYSCSIKKYPVFVYQAIDILLLINEILLLEIVQDHEPRHGQLVTCEI